jgi:hypothetical protein
VLPNLVSCGGRGRPGTYICIQSVLCRLRYQLSVQRWDGGSIPCGSTTAGGHCRESVTNSQKCGQHGRGGYDRKVHFKSLSSMELEGKTPGKELVSSNNRGGRKPWAEWNRTSNLT